ncbi:Sodium-dependent glucose transporter-like protein, partial [Euroglyphus maynei]
MLASIFHSFIPQMPNIAMFYLAAFGSGFGLGTFNAVCTTWLMEMWHGKRLSSVLQAGQFMYGLGSIFSPIMVKPFIHGNNSNSTTNQTFSIDTRRNDLTTPFSISGALEFAVGASIFALFFLYRYRKDDTSSDMANGGGWGGSSQPKKLLDDDRHSCKRISYHVLITAIFAAYNLTEIGFSSFQNTYYQQ